MAGCFRCICCSFSGDTVESLEGHIASEHLKYFPIECFHCQYVRLPTEHFIRQHMKEQHPGDIVKWIYTPDDKQKSILETLLQSSLPGAKEEMKVSRSEEGVDVVKPLGWEEANMATGTVNILTDGNLMAGRLSEEHSTSSPKSLPETTPEAGARKQSSQLESRIAVPSGHKRKKSDIFTCAKCQKELTYNHTRFHVATRHLTQNTLICPYCSHGLSGNICHMRDHVTKNHEGKPFTFIDRRAELREEIDQLHRECFPDLKVGCRCCTRFNSEGFQHSFKAGTPQGEKKIFTGAKTKKLTSGLRERELDLADDKSRVSCSVCGVWLCDNFGVRLGHVLTHLQKDQLWCGYCNYKNNGRVSKLKSHMHTVHNGMDTDIYRDERLQHFEETRDMMLRCFPGNGPPLDLRKFMDFGLNKSKQEEGNECASLKEPLGSAKKDRPQESNQYVVRMEKSLPIEPRETLSPVRKSKRNIQRKRYGKQNSSEDDYIQ